MSKRTIELKGIIYSSIADCAKDYNLNPKLISNRLNSGWTTLEALEITTRRKSKPNRRQSIIIKVNGLNKEYTTIKDAAIEFKLDPKLVRARITQHGWSPEEALDIVKRKKRKAHNSKKVEFKFEDKSYSFESVSEAAHSMGLSEFLVFGRINNRGWTIEQALELSPPPEHSKTCYAYIYLITNTINDIKYVGQTLSSINDRLESHIKSASKHKPKNQHSLAHAITKYGRESFTIEQIDTAESLDELNRLERYWIKTLNTLYPTGYNLNRGGSGISQGQSIEVNSLKFPSISEAAREHGISQRLVSERLRSGWTIDQSFELVDAPDSHKYSGKTISVTDNGTSLKFLSIGELANHYKLPYSTVLQRLTKLKWSPEAAVDLVEPPRWCHPMHKFQITVDGNLLTFESKSRAAKHFGIQRWHTVTRRLKRGWTIEQALNLSPAPLNHNAPIKITININGRSIEYASQTKAAKSHGVCFKRVSARVKLGWSYEEALEIIPRNAST
jgi:hypothetical protein